MVPTFRKLKLSPFWDCLSGGQQFVATQHGAELFNALGGPARQVGEGSVLGLAGLAVALPQQDGGW